MIPLPYREFSALLPAVGDAGPSFESDRSSGRALEQGQNATVGIAARPAIPRRRQGLCVGALSLASLLWLPVCRGAAKTHIGRLGVCACRFVISGEVLGCNHVQGRDYCPASRALEYC